MLMTPSLPKQLDFLDIFSSSSARVGDQLSGILRPVAPALAERKLQVGMRFMVRADLELTGRMQILALGELCAQTRGHLVV